MTTVPHRKWRRRGRILAVATALAAAAAVGLPWPRPLAVALAPDAGLLAMPRDPVVTDRIGQALRHPPGAHGTRGVWTPLARLPDRLVAAFLAAEDARFRSHPGFDVLAICRAAFDNLMHGRVVSGASTITSQLVRILEPRPRTLGAKVIEAVRSLALEKLYTKDQILEQYLNRVPMPGNVRGVTTAARLLFGREPAALTLGECALLASLPQSPTRFDPRRIAARGDAARADRERLDRRWRWVLERMVELAYITPDDRDAALAEPPRLALVRFPFGAPHLVDHLSKSGGSAPVQTTLDPIVQAIAERVLAQPGRGRDGASHRCGADRAHARRPRASPARPAPRRSSPTSCAGCTPANRPPRSSARPASSRERSAPPRAACPRRPVPRGPHDIAVSTPDLAQTASVKTRID
jgi:membrane peptidoglycan carboxypeptidase